MIVLATAHVESPSAESLMERWATRADRVHADSRRSRTAQSASLLARAALRALLFSHTAQTEWNLRADSRGKLSAFSTAGEAGPAVCLAHSHGRIACGLGDVGALGIDIESHRPRNVNAIADWAFGPQERATIATGGAAAFYRIWTLREAMAKATGEGLALVTDRADRVNGGPESGPWRARVDGRIWLLEHFSPGRDSSFAVAALLADDDMVNPTAVRLLDLGDRAGNGASGGIP